MSRTTYRNAILSFPRQFDAKHLRKNGLAQLAKGARPDGIVLVGMGGSGLAGDILAMLETELGLPVPLVVWKNYYLPETSFKRPLYIFSSFSGNTEETLSGLTDLLAKKAARRVAVVSSLDETGATGMLGNLAAEYKLPSVFFPSKNLTPRGALGYSVRSVITLLKSCFPSLRVSKVFPGNIHPDRLEAEGKRIAAICRTRPVAIYTNTAFAGLGYIWKITMNETGKHPAFASVLPEADHNELGGFEGSPVPFAALFLRGKEAPRMRKKMLLTERTLKDSGVATTHTPLKGRTAAEMVWNGIVLAEWTALHLARTKKTDPERTELIEHFKKMMGRAS